jgi:hypothetical protein
MQTLSDRAILVWAMLTAGLIALLIDWAGDVLDLLVH